MTVSFTSTTAALSTLRGINNQIDATARTISSGMTVASAGDGPSTWATAATIRSDVGALEAVSEAMSFGKTFLEATGSGLSTARETLQDVMELLVSAQSVGVDRAAIQTEIAGLLEDLRSVAGASTITQQNILSVDSDDADYNPTCQVVANFSSGASGVSLSTIDVDVEATKLLDAAAGADGILDRDRTAGGTTMAVLDIDISGLTDAAGDQTTLAEILDVVDGALSDIIDAETAIGSAIDRAATQSDFISAIIDANERAVSTLVEANLEEEAARLSALQTQQQLAIEAISISNNAMSNILALFR